MVKKILSFFYTDLQWKLISLGLAVVVWFFAMNMHDPIVNETFTNPIRFLNEHYLERDGLVLLNRDELLDVSINLGARALSSDFAGLTAEERASFFPFIDFRAVDHVSALASDEPHIQELSINSNLMYGFAPWFVRDASGNSTVEVQLDRELRQPFPVGVEYIGQVSDGFELRSVQAVNRNVMVIGARTHVNRVAYVRVEVDLANADGDFDVPEAPLRVFDYNGVDMTSYVSLSVMETHVNVHVLPVRTVGIRIEPVGQVASGFALADLDSYYVFVDVVGAAEILAETDYITLQFDLDGLAEDDEQQLDIILPEGLELSRSAPTETTVSVVIEPIMRRTFNVSGSEITQRGFGAFAEPIDDNVNVRVVVSGPQSLVGTMNRTDIGIEVDLINLPIGIHRVPLNANLPQGITLAEPLQALDIQVFAPARGEDQEPPGDTAPDITPTPTPTPTPPPIPPTDDNGYDENGTNDDPGYTGYPDNDEDYPPDDDPYNGYYYEGD
ncbi:MAG: CdaR family protein [Defluviitaleaceae bacterium]|nr:CdaR family protein [Defluviitaleaceae bacterium]